MELKNLLALEPAKLIAAIKGTVDYEPVETYIKEFAGTHTILNRPDKTLADKNVVTTAKLVVNLQKKIVNSSVFFLFGGDMRLLLESEDEPSDQQREAYDHFVAQWERAKLNTFNRNLARVLLSETRAAELYYPVEETQEGAEAKFRYRVKLLAKSLGDEIYPFYDDFGDLVAFMRQYTKAIIKDDGSAGTTDITEIYTADTNYVLTKAGSDWLVEKTTNTFKKIPVIFYETSEADWTIVQALIDKLEDRFSKFDDTNDYFSSPAVKVSGKLVSSPEKGEIGKLFELAPDGKGGYGDVEYLTWDQSPDSMKMELEMLLELTYGLTDTPNLTFDRLKGLGSYSGAALRFLFMGAQMKSKVNQDIFAEGIDRRISLLKTMQATFITKQTKALQEIAIKADFGDPLPVDENETITNIVSSFSTGIMSRETSLQKHPYIEDPTKEAERLATEDIAEPNAGLNE